MTRRTLLQFVAALLPASWVKREKSLIEKMREAIPRAKFKPPLLAGGPIKHDLNGYSFGAPITMIQSTGDTLYVTTTKGAYAVTGEMHAATIRQLPRFTPEES